MFTTARLILSQRNQIHSFPPCFPKTHFNTILPSTLRSSEWPFPSWLPKQNFVFICHLPRARYIPRPSYPSWFDHPNNIIWRIRIVELLIMQFFLHPCHFIPLRSKYSPQHPFLKHTKSWVIYEITKSSQANYINFSVYPPVTTTFTHYSYCVRPTVRILYIDS
jgi:hypothetical protein